MVARMSRSKTERAPLLEAAIDGDAARVRELLRAGADPNMRDESRWTPLHFGAQDQALGVVMALLEAGAEVDSPDDHGNTPLWRATFTSRGHGEVIRALREAGANPWYTNSRGISPAALARTIANFPVAQHFADLPPAPPAA